MVDFDDMSYETLQSAVQRKFDVELPDQPEEITIKNCSKMISNSGDFSSLSKLVEHTLL